MYTIEIVTFYVKNGVKEEKLLQASEDFGKMLQREIKGFAKRTLTKYHDSEKWLEILWWENMESAQNALETATKMPEFDAYNALLEEEGSKIFYVEEKQ